MPSRISRIAAFGHRSRRMRIAFPATSPFGPPVNFTENGSVRMSTPISRMAISANFTTPVEVTPYSLWLIPTRLLDMMPIPSMYPRRTESSAIVSIISSCMFSSGPSSIGSSSP